MIEGTKGDYTLQVRKIEQLLRTYSLPTLPTVFDLGGDALPITVSANVFENSDALLRRQNYLHSLPENREEEVPFDPNLDISLEYNREQLQLVSGSSLSLSSEFRFPELATGVRGVSYALCYGSFSIIHGTIGADGTLIHASLDTSLMDEIFGEETKEFFITRKSGLKGIRGKPPENYIVKFQEPFDHSILLTYLFAKLKDGFL